MKKVGIISLGCCKNLTDSENILGVLSKSSVVFSNRISECDLIIINTCGFIESAKQEAKDTIIECYHKKKDGAKMLVCGCFAQRYKEYLKEEYEGIVDAIVPIKEYEAINETIQKLLYLNVENN